LEKPEILMPTPPILPYQLLIPSTYSFKKEGPNVNLEESSDYKYSEQSSRKKSDKRMKRQVRRLDEKHLEYESKESYNPRTKRTSRVLVCLHEGCGKEFKKTRNLIIHARVHTKEKPHICEYCSKGFTQQCNLNKHTELHQSGKFRQQARAI
jgi:uncharacterized Zn-finger protein